MIVPLRARVIQWIVLSYKTLFVLLIVFLIIPLCLMRTLLFLMDLLELLLSPLLYLLIMKISLFQMMILFLRAMIREQDLKIPAYILPVNFYNELYSFS